MRQVNETLPLAHRFTALPIAHLEGLR